MKLSGMAVGFVALASIFSPLAAQEVAPLVRDRESGVSVTVKSKDDKKTAPGVIATPTPIPTPTPDPAKVIVAIVNNHSITKAQMDRRVAAMMGRRDDKVTAEDLMGTTRKAPTGSSTLMKSLAASDPNIVLEEKLMAEQQKIETEEAIRAAEEQMIFDWKNQMLLADEARRHGFIISDRELQDRMRGLERDFDISGKRVNSMLEAFGMTRDEFESYVYDAILIEKLLDRYVQLNMTEEMLREAYNLNPENFIDPPSYEIAHFVITLTEADTAKFREGYKKNAEKVRTRLEKGEDPAKIFKEVSDLEMGTFGSVYTASLDNRLMDPDVRKTILKMKPGETSKILEINVLLDGKAVPEAYHVIKLLKYTPAKGGDFESAIPKLRRAAGELARQNVLEMIREAKTHRVITNFSGVPANKIPSAATLRQQQAPISLKIQARANP